MNTKSSQQKMMMVAALAALGAAATGCNGDVGMALAPLDQPTMVVANDTQPQSQVTVYHQGTLDPGAGLAVLTVNKGFIRMRSEHNRATVEQLILLLGDTDLPPSGAMPNGLKLRHQSLELSTPVEADVNEKTMNALNVHAQGALSYRADLVQDDGTLRALGPVQANVSGFDVRATRYEFGVHVTVDAAPKGQCLSIPGVLDISNCSLFVELDGDSHAN
jgi:hypothetical protein